MKIIEHMAAQVHVQHSSLHIIGAYELDRHAQTLRQPS
jgi:hypothetical protein